MRNIFLILYLFSSFIFASDISLTFFLDRNQEYIYRYETQNKNIIEPLGPVTNDFYAKYIFDPEKTSAKIVSKNILLNSVYRAEIDKKTQHINSALFNDHIIFTSNDALNAYNLFIVIPQKNLDKYNEIFDANKLTTVSQENLQTLFNDYREHRPEARDISHKELEELFTLLTPGSEHKLGPVVLHGHGAYSFRIDKGFISGLTVDNFTNFLLFFQSKKAVFFPSLLIYSTCHSGGQNLIIPYVKESHPLKFDYTLMPSHISDFPTCSGRMDYDQKELNTLAARCHEESLFPENALPLNKMLRKITAQPDGMICYREKGDKRFTFIEREAYSGEEYFLIGPQVYDTNEVGKNYTKETPFSNIYFNEFEIHVESLSNAIRSITNYDDKIDFSLYTNMLILKSKPPTKMGGREIRNKLEVEESLKDAIFIIEKNNTFYMKLGYVFINLKNNADINVYYSPYHPDIRTKELLPSEKFYRLSMKKHDKYFVIVNNQELDKKAFFSELALAMKSSIIKDESYMLDYRLNKKTPDEKAILKLIDANQDREKFGDELRNFINSHEE